MDGWIRTLATSFNGSLLINPRTIGAHPSILVLFNRWRIALPLWCVIYVVLYLMRFTLTWGAKNGPRIKSRVDPRSSASPSSLSLSLSLIIIWRERMHFLDTQSSILLQVLERMRRNLWRLLMLFLCWKCFSLLAIYFNRNRRERERERERDLRSDFLNVPWMMNPLLNLPARVDLILIHPLTHGSVINEEKEERERERERERIKWMLN